MPTHESPCLTKYEDETDPETGLLKAVKTALDGSAISVSKFTLEWCLLLERNHVL